MILQNIGEKPLNKTSVPNSFKSFIKEVDQKNPHKLLARKSIKIITSEQN